MGSNVKKWKISLVSYFCKDVKRSAVSEAAILVLLSLKDLPQRFTEGSYVKSTTANLRKMKLPDLRRLTAL